ncbi:MAG: 3-methylornithine--L-lysine ligase PylC [Deltaproteobacteria bacterium]|nr:3-methylornithine--L-lysine ligase PylC [Deltaproteobacteria bacterium]MBW2678637.1 3-methylornithine--L-lysine ligase PylC [Deltaproteobacteria bacterium]
MLVAVAGGNLQGVEVAYLARKAGWEVLVVDRRAGVPAAGLADRFVQLDLRREEAFRKLLADVDLLIPALENDAALASLTRCARSADVPFAFDPSAYAVSSSKRASDLLFDRSGIPCPAAWPHCPMPVIVKPSRDSGSANIKIIREKDALKAFLAKAGGEWVVQAYIEGPTYSLEVLGNPGDYRVLQVTDLYMDDVYDCKAVVAPSLMPAELVSGFEKISRKLAGLVNLEGLMDVEVIMDQGELKVLEIDARFPSQTPTAVYHSTGFNMLEAMGGLFLTGKSPAAPDCDNTRGVVYEHIRIAGGAIAFSGEHIMSDAGPLHVVEGFFGADEAITNYTAGRAAWVATLIISGNDRREAYQKRARVLENLKQDFGLTGRVATL